MKKLILLSTSLLLCTMLKAQTNVFPSTGAAGIGTTSPDPSSLLDVTSTSKGILIPRMTEEQRNALVSPAEGLLIYQTNHTPGFYYYGGKAWKALAGWSLHGNSSTNPDKEFIGTTDAEPLIFKVNNQEAGFLGNDNSYNTSFGYEALNNFGNIETGNSGFGFQALFSNTTGGANTASGTQSLYSNSTGFNNTAIGAESQYSNTTGYNNTSAGLWALHNNIIGAQNTAIGSNALLSNTADFNTAVGSSALVNNTLGYDNVAFGYVAMSFNSSGEENTASGTYSLYDNTTGSYNTANGSNALYSNILGHDNVADGFEALYFNNNGSDNVASGVRALYLNTAGIYNTAIGYNALYSNTGGVNNQGTNNTAIGYSADANAGILHNSTALGSSSIITASKQVRIGDNAVTSIGGYTDWTNISDARVKKNIKQNVPGLAFINLLKPVTYNYDLDAADKIIWPDGRPQPKDFQEPDQLKQLDEQAKQEKEQIAYTGFLAQDVETAAKSIGYDFSGVDSPKNDKDLYGLRYAEFVVPLVKAVQELDESQKQEAKSQNDETDSLKAEVEMLKSQVANLQTGASGNFKFQTSDSKLQTAVLYQNLPNPFNQSTVIPFHIPQDCRDASIMITNTSSGEVVSVIPVSCNDDHVQINSGALSSGNYSYSLFVNGKIMDTKQMIIQK